MSAFDTSAYHQSDVMKSRTQFSVPIPHIAARTTMDGDELRIASPPLYLIPQTKLDPRNEEEH